MSAQLTIEERIAQAAAKVGPPRSIYDDAPPRKRSIAERFEDFHRDNPQVYAELLKLAKRAAARGCTRLGIKCLWESVRYNLSVSTYSPDGYKLNNDFTARYARLLMEQEPELAGLFETRAMGRKRAA